MTIQRRRSGIPARVYMTTESTDSRGNVHRHVDLNSPTDVQVWVFPQRSAKAEVPGQQHINVIRIGTRVLTGVDLWSRVDMLGKSWDVVTPPAYHHGTRSVRHWSLDIRERP